MFDGKIDFMDFNKIKINYGGKLTCRKVFKKKYLLFLIFSIILIFILIYFFANKKKQISDITILMKELEKEKSQIENNLNTQNFFLIELFYAIWHIINTKTGRRNEFE